MDIVKLETGNIQITISQSDFDLLFDMLCKSTCHVTDKSESLMNRFFCFVSNYHKLVDLNDQKFI